MPREKMPEQLRKPSPTSQDSGATTVSMSATEMSEDRSRGMYHSLIGKPSLRVVLVMGLLIGLCLLLLAACGGQKSTSGGSASTDSRIVFHRYLDPAQPKTKSAIFTMYPNGSHIRQITHPPKGWSDRH